MHNIVWIWNSTLKHSFTKFVRDDILLKNLIYVGKIFYIMISMRNMIIHNVLPDSIPPKHFVKTLLFHIAVKSRQCTRNIVPHRNKIEEEA